MCLYKYKKTKNNLGDSDTYNLIHVTIVRYIQPASLEKRHSRFQKTALESSNVTADITGFYSLSV